MPKSSPGATGNCADNNRDSNAATHPADAAHDHTQHREVLAHPPAPRPELIKKRSEFKGPQQMADVLGGEEDGFPTSSCPE